MSYFRVSTLNRVQTNYDCHVQHSLPSGPVTVVNEGDVRERAAQAWPVSTGSVLVLPFAMLVAVCVGDEVKNQKSQR